jgi:ABC-type glycerol-3-phosphate transport system substrate-binding protein
LKTATPATVQLPENATPAAGGPVTLRLWIPPELDPASGSPAGELLQARLEEFESRRPGVRIQVRVKAADGPGGLLESLVASSAAAPLALPDLVALPRPALEQAALKGLLRSFDGLTDTLNESDWYDYARQMAYIQNSIFGLPFAGDALVLAYHPSINSPPSDWATTLLPAENEDSVLAYPAADPQALFTLLQYQASGGEVTDEQGRPAIDPEKLAGVLSFYQQAEKAGVMPVWLTQYQDFDQIWETLSDNRSDQAAVWSSRFLLEMLPAEIPFQETQTFEALTETVVAPLPTPDGNPFTLATGWVWALASPHPEHYALSVELAEFLSTSDFLAEWAQVGGFLPPRPSALQAWERTGQTLPWQAIALSAKLLPSQDVLFNLGPALQLATIEALKQQGDPLTLARQAAQSLGAP